MAGEVKKGAWVREKSKGPTGGPQMKVEKVASGEAVCVYTDPRSEKTERHKIKVGKLEVLTG